MTGADGAGARPGRACARGRPTSAVAPPARPADPGGAVVPRSGHPVAERRLAPGTAPTSVGPGVGPRKEDRPALDAP